MLDRRSAAAPAQRGRRAPPPIAGAKDRPAGRIWPKIRAAVSRQAPSSSATAPSIWCTWGTCIHFEEAARPGRPAGRHRHRGQAHHQEARGLDQRGYRARQVASLEIVDYVAIVDEPSAAAAIEALRPDVYVKGSEYSNLLLDKTSNIFREKTLVESYGGRIHFTSGETFSSTKLSHFLLSSPEAAQDNPAAPQRARRCSATCRAAASRSRRSRDFWRARAGSASASSAKRSSTSGSTSRSRTCRRSRAASRGWKPAGCGRSAATGIIALHLAGFVKSVHCFTNGLRADDVPQNVTVTPLADSPLVKTRFVDREHRLPALRVEASWTLSGRPRRCCPISTTTIWCCSPISATDCSTRAAINRQLAGEAARLVAAMVAGQLEQLRLQPADQVRRRRLLQPEPHRGRALACTSKDTALPRAGRSDGGAARLPQAVGHRRQPTA